MKKFLTVLALMVAVSLPASAGDVKTGGRFILKDHNGRIVTDNDYRGKFMLILFGYTFCPDICPTGLQEMADAMNLLDGQAKDVQPLFITVDPDRDTAIVMAAYVKAFDERITGLTGSKAAIASVTKKYRVKYVKAETKPGDEDYTMDHTAAMFLMGPDGSYITRFGYGTPAEKIAKTLSGEIKAAEQ